MGRGRLGGGIGRKKFMKSGALGNAFLFFFFSFILSFKIEKRKQISIQSDRVRVIFNIFSFEWIMGAIFLSLLPGMATDLQRIRHNL